MGLAEASPPRTDTSRGTRDLPKQHFEEVMVRSQAMRTKNPVAERRLAKTARQTRLRLHAIYPALAASLVGLTVLGGCGSGKPASQEVGGRVTLQNEPLRKGLIEFVPTVPGGSRAGAIVRNGQYTVRREAGLLPGNYRVTIASKVPRMADWEETDANGAAARPQNIQISEKYNINTVLTAEVKSDGKQTLDFDLE